MERSVGGCFPLSSSAGRTGHRENPGSTWRTAASISWPASAAAPRCSDRWPSDGDEGHLRRHPSRGAPVDVSACGRTGLRPRTRPLEFWTAWWGCNSVLLTMDAEPSGTHADRGAPDRGDGCTTAPAGGLRRRRALPSDGRVRAYRASRAGGAGRRGRAACRGDDEEVDSDADAADAAPAILPAGSPARRVGADQRPSAPVTRLWTGRPRDRNSPGIPRRSCPASRAAVPGQPAPSHPAPEARRRPEADDVEPVVSGGRTSRRACRSPHDRATAGERRGGRDGEARRTSGLPFSVERGAD